MAEFSDIIDGELARAEVYWQSHLQQERDDALDYFAGRKRESDTEEDGSGYVSEDVAAGVQANLAEMVGSLCGDTLATFKPKGKEDEDQAQLESDVVNDMVIQSEEGQAELIQALHDALLLRNGIIKIEMSETRDVRTEEHEGLEPGELAGAVATNDPNEFVRFDLRDDGVTVITRELRRRRLEFRSVSPARMVFSLDAESLDLNRCPFFAEEMFVTRADLVEMGVDRAVAYELRGQERTNDVRGAKIQPVRPEGEAPTDPSMTLVRVWDVGIQIDRNDDGKAELWRALYASDDKQVLLEQEYPFPWYSIGTTEIVPHSLLGRSVFDRLRQVQDSKTEAVRAWENNLHENVRQEIVVVDGMVNEDDLENRRIGRSKIRVKREGAVMYPQVPDLGSNSGAFISYMDTVRSEQAGASLDLQNAGAQVQGQSGVAIDREYTKREKVAELQLRSIALTLIRGAVKIAHATLRTFSPGPIEAKFRGNWQTTNPAEWPERDEVRIVPGLTDRERGEKIAALDHSIQAQMLAIQSGLGGELADANTLHNALTDRARLSKVELPERYYIDPQSQEAQQAAAQKQQQAQQAQAEQARVTALLLEIQQNLRVYQTNVEYRFKYFDALLDAEKEVMKTLGASTERLEGMQLQGLGAMYERANEEQAAQDTRPGNGQGGPVS